MSSDKREGSSSRKACGRAGRKNCSGTVREMHSGSDETGCGKGKLCRKTISKSIENLQELLVAPEARRDDSHDSRERHRQVDVLESFKKHHQSYNNQ